MTAKPQTIDEYLAPLGSEKKAALEKLRRAIRSAAPKAEECISYGIPAFRLGGKLLVAFGAAAKHCAFYPGAHPVVAHAAELEGFETSKGTVRFRMDRPLPAALVRKMVKTRIEERMPASKPAKKPAKQTAPRKHIHYHKDGTVWARGQLTDGVMTGYWEWFRKDGVRMRSGHFEKGEQVGEWTTYDRTGAVYKVTTMKPKKQPPAAAKRARTKAK